LVEDGLLFVLSVRRPLCVCSCARVLVSCVLARANQHFIVLALGGLLAELEFSTKLGIELGFRSRALQVLVLLCSCVRQLFVRLCSSFVYSQLSVPGVLLLRSAAPPSALRPGVARTAAGMQISSCAPSVISQAAGHSFNAVCA
jgi:hypothetical protein